MSVAVEDPRTLGLAFVDRLLFSINENLDVEKANQVIFDIGPGGSCSLDDIALLPPGRLDRIERTDLKKLCQAVSTTQHESRHIQQASNTAAGFLLAMTQRQLAVSALESLQDLRADGLKEFPLPFLSLDSVARVKPSAAAKSARKTAEMFIAMHRQTLDVASASEVSVGQAIDRDQELERLRPRSSLELKTELPTDSPVAPNELTLHHLLEADAHAADCSILSLAASAGVPGPLVNEIVNELAADETYTYAKQVFLHHTQGRYRRGPYLTHFIAALNVAMSPTILRGEANYLEDVFPAWRFIRICDSLATLKVPDDSLLEFAEFAEVVAAAIGWPSPIETMLYAVEDDRWASLPDPLMKDLFARRQYFCEFVTRTGQLPLTPGSTPAEYFDRFLPWALKANGRFLFVNYPKGNLSVEGAGFALMQHALGEDVLFASNLSKARQFFRQMWGHLVVRGEWTEDRLSFELQEYIDSLVTGEGQTKILESGLA